tara:strand:- start:603 stop:761 length:159 start_codon:yes stop_codon:yes gene_type:complete
MKKVFVFICQNGKVIPFIFLLALFLSSCTGAKDLCAAYAYNDDLSTSTYSSD